MKIQALDHKKVCILGYGKEGRATFRALKQYAPGAHITIADGNAALEGEPDTPLITGPNYLDPKHLEAFDAIIKSPGIAWRSPAKLQTKLTSATEIFLDSLPEDVTVIGVTGTKGKSTTSNLIYQALEAGDKRVFLAGNIGEPMLEFLDEATPGTTFVLELSSYQLETLKTSPHIAVVTSFFPDHLDYHGGLNNYHEAKKNIARYQTSGDVVFYNPSYPECQEIADLSAGQKVPFRPEDFPGHASEVLSGTQNRSNLAAAYRVALHCGVPSEQAVEALEHATGLPHRQESLGLQGGIEWIDDSAATTPESTLAALETLGGRVDTIIVGGLDRGYDFAALGQALASSTIRHIILFPETGAKIQAAVEFATEAAQLAAPKQYYETADMTEAVAYARSHTQAGKAVLLSSGSPSYNLFKNYPERGRIFREAIFGSTAAPTAAN